ncbi:MAG: hypothetical protein V1644_02185, partial [Candidatus Micrarchaeota archaeon]
SIYNNCTSDDIEWNNDFDKVFGCSEEVGCVPYTLNIRDNNSRVYTCQGVYGSNSGNHKQVNCDAFTLDWYEDKEAKLAIKASPCRVNLKFGKGRFVIEGKDVVDQDCDINMTTNVAFNFTTSSFWTDFSTQMIVRDNLNNYSAETAVR